MAALPFLTGKNEDEESALKRILGYAFYLVTIGLMLLNISGAWIGSKGNLFYTIAIMGAELFVALALGALIFTRNNLRFGVGMVVFLVGVWITLENGKMAITHSMDDVFTGTPTELREQALLADKRAVELDAEAVDGKTNDKQSLTDLREEMAALRVESALMQSQSADGITRAQTALKAMGMYRGPIDGIRENLTEGAMELRGEQIASRMALVQSQIDTLTGVAAPPPAAEAPPPPTDTPAEAKRKEAIELRKQATEVEERTLWLHILLIGLEGIRSLALWVFLMDGTMTASRLKRKALDQLALARVHVQIAEINSQINALQAPATVAALESIPAPPVAVEPPPAPIPPPEPEPAPAATPEPEPEPLTLVDPVPEMTAQQRAARQGGLAAQHERRAAKTEKLLVIGPVSTIDAQLAKVAAQ
jgi:peptidoglycan hydrolase-like protein with peptidoglycan-binding domain